MRAASNAATWISMRLVPHDERVRAIDCWLRLRIVMSSAPEKTMAHAQCVGRKYWSKVGPPRGDPTPHLAIAQVPAEACEPIGLIAGRALMVLAVLS